MRSIVLFIVLFVTYASCMTLDDDDDNVHTVAIRCDNTAVESLQTPIYSQLEGMPRVGGWQDRSSKDCGLLKITGSDDPAIPDDIQITCEGSAAAGRIHITGTIGTQRICSDYTNVRRIKAYLHNGHDQYSVHGTCNDAQWPAQSLRAGLGNDFIGIHPTTKISEIDNGLGSPRNRRAGIGAKAGEQIQHFSDFCNSNQYDQVEPMPSVSTGTVFLQTPLDIDGTPIQIAEDMDAQRLVFTARFRGVNPLARTNALAWAALMFDNNAATGTPLAADIAALARMRTPVDTDNHELIYATAVQATAASNAQSGSVTGTRVTMTLDFTMGIGNVAGGTIAGGNIAYLDLTSSTTINIPIPAGVYFPTFPIRPLITIFPPFDADENCPNDPNCHNGPPFALGTMQCPAPDCNLFINQPVGTCTSFICRRCQSSTPGELICPCTCINHAEGSLIVDQVEVIQTNF